MAGGRVIFAWSGGKDSALALHELWRRGEHEVVGLLTTLSAEEDRVFMSALRSSLLVQQAGAIGLPLEQVRVARDAGEDDYRGQMEDVVARYAPAGMAYGDIFLEDLRQQRVDTLRARGLEAIFPLWKRDTGTLAREFLRRGFQAVVTCVDTQYLAAEFVGRHYDQAFLDALPAGVDPCGENGEFHSFVFAGPIFRAPIPFELGDMFWRDERYCYRDVLPG